MAGAGSDVVAGAGGATCAEAVNEGAVVKGGATRALGSEGAGAEEGVGGAEGAHGAAGADGAPEERAAARARAREARRALHARLAPGALLARRAMIAPTEGRQARPTRARAASRERGAPAGAGPRPKKEEPGERVARCAGAALLLAASGCGGRRRAARRRPANPRTTLWPEGRSMVVVVVVVRPASRRSGELVGCAVKPASRPAADQGKGASVRPAAGAGEGANTAAGAGEGANAAAGEGECTNPAAGDGEGANPAAGDGEGAHAAAVRAEGPSADWSGARDAVGEGTREAVTMAGAGEGTSVRTAAGAGEGAHTTAGEGEGARTAEGEGEGARHDDHTVGRHAPPCSAASAARVSAPRSSEAAVAERSEDGAAEGKRRWGKRRGRSAEAAVMRGAAVTPRMKVRPVRAPTRRDRRTTSRRERSLVRWGWWGLVIAPVTLPAPQAAIASAKAATAAARAAPGPLGARARTAMVAVVERSEDKAAVVRRRWGKRRGRSAEAAVMRGAAVTPRMKVRPVRAPTRRDRRTTSRRGRGMVRWWRWCLVLEPVTLPAPQAAIASANAANAAARAAPGSLGPGRGVWRAACDAAGEGARATSGGSFRRVGEATRGGVQGGSSSGPGTKAAAAAGRRAAETAVPRAKKVLAKRPERMPTRRVREQLPERRGMVGMVAVGAYR